MNNSIDKVELALPFKPEYVSVARLAVSGIASRIGFDIDTIEDIKVSVAEVCNRIVRAGAECTGGYSIIFSITEEKLDINFECKTKTFDTLFGGEDDELGISIINAFMDEVEFDPANSHILFMSKAVEGNLLI